jgi:uncharacterized membrane protein required for colicin V production
MLKPARSMGDAMNWIDAVVLIGWGGTALWGFSTGLIRILISLVVVIIGLALSSRIGEDVGNIFSVVTGDERAQAIGGFVLVFGGLFIIGAIAGFVVGNVTRRIPLCGVAKGTAGMAAGVVLLPFGIANRMAGMAVGVIIGFLLLSGVLTGVQKYTDRIDDDIDDSTLGAFMADNFDVVLRGVKLIPGDWDDQLLKPDAQ